jgi:hypothetical protein
MTTTLKDPQERVYFRSKKLNRRTIAALKYAEKIDGIKQLYVIAQGSYNRGGVSQSAGTHDGGGAVDISDSNLTDEDRKKVVRALKDSGFAAWFRPEIPGYWGSHIHAILKNDPEISSGAAQQVASFNRGRSGLRGDAPDPTYRPDPPVRFSYNQNKPVPE